MELDAGPSYVDGCELHARGHVMKILIDHAGLITFSGPSPVNPVMIDDANDEFFEDLVTSFLEANPQY
jgi:hypothetical protein